MMNNDWIPVKERLPKNGHYLVSCEGGSVHKDFYWDGKWENKGYYNILAWQPLPKPYKEEGMCKRMKFKICYSGEYEDSFIIEGNTIPEIRERVLRIIDDKGWDSQDWWSERLED